MNFDTIDFKNKKSKGKSYKNILDSVGKDVGLLETYMVAKRSLELASRKKKTGVDVDAANKVVQSIEGGNPKIVQAAKDLQQFQDDVLVYYRDSGLISKDDYSRIKALNKDYVPFHRVYEDGLKPQKKGKKQSSANVLKGITKEGSERDIVSPLRTIAKNTEALVTMAEHNRYLKDTIDWTLKQEGGQDYLEKSVKFKSTKVGKDDLPDELKDIVSDDFSLDVFRSDKGVTEPNEIAIYRDGKKEVYTIKDADLAEAFQSLQPHQFGAIIKAASTITRFKRAGITNSLTFGVTNFFRAEMSASVNSPDTYIPLYDGLRGLVDLTAATVSPDSFIGKTEYGKRMRNLYKDWMSAGGGRSTMIDIDDTYIKRGLDRYLKEGERNIIGRNPIENIAQVSKAVTYIPRKFLQFLEDTSSFAENAPRFKQFQKSIESGADPVKASYESAEIATNFSKKGSSNTINALRQTSTFLGATAQSYDKMVRQLATRPRDTIIRSLTMLTVPSVTLHLTHHYQEDENGNLVQADWYKKTPQYVKDLFWVVNVGTDDSPVVMRFPKPYDYGLLFATSAENFVDFIVSEDPDAAKQFGKSLFDNLAPSVDLFSPDVITPFVEVASNHSIFKDAPIVPRSKENLLSQLQASSYSTQLSRELSQSLTELVPEMDGSRFLSPAGIEHFVNSWTGTIGSTSLQGLDSILQEAGILKETPKTRANLTDVGKKALSLIGLTDPDPDTPVHLMDVPIFKAFFVRDGLGAREIDTFYKNKRDNTMFEKSLNFVKKTDPKMYEYVLNKIQERGGIVDLTSSEKPMIKALETINRISQAPNDVISVKDKQNLLKPLTHAVYLYAESLNKRFEAQREILDTTMKKKKEYDKMRLGE